MSETLCNSYKVILLGDSTVGKTSLIQRFVSNQFTLSTMSTLGSNSFQKMIQIGSERVQLMIWDTAGQERFNALTPTFYRGVKGAVLVYDITNQSSFNSLKKWLKQLEDHTDNPAIMLIANKSDIKDRRQVATQSGIDFAKTHSMLFFETSCLEDNSNVESAFVQLAEHILDMNTRVRKFSGNISLFSPGIEQKASKNITPRNSETPQPKKKKSCC